jgi:peroxiredoxin
MKLLGFFLTFIFIQQTSFILCQNLHVGNRATDFSLPCATKDSIFQQEVKLSGFNGIKEVVIAFYPADWSPGCTKQLCSFRDSFSKFKDLSAEILAISGDYVWSHHNWAENKNYPFKLLADHSHRVAKLYESYNSESGYNKRTVFVIDKKGLISYIDWKYNVTSDTSSVNLQKALTLTQK